MTCGHGAIKSICCSRHSTLTSQLAPPVAAAVLCSTGYDSTPLPGWAPSSPISIPHCVSTVGHQSLEAPSGPLRSDPIQPATRSGHRRISQPGNTTALFRARGLDGDPTEWFPTSKGAPAPRSQGTAPPPPEMLSTISSSPVPRPPPPVAAAVLCSTGCDSTPLPGWAPPSPHLDPPIAFPR